MYLTNQIPGFMRTVVKSALESVMVIRGMGYKKFRFFFVLTTHIISIHTCQRIMKIGNGNLVCCCNLKRAPGQIEVSYYHQQN